MVRGNSLVGRSEANDHELQSAPAKIENTKPKVQGCLECEHGINVNLGRKHTVECRQTILPSLETDSLWTVKLDTDGNVLERHGQDNSSNRKQGHTGSILQQQESALSLL